MKNLILLCLCISLFACKDSKQTYTPLGIAEGVISIDGQNEESVWQQATAITAFTNPWAKDVNPYTSLKMLKDSQYVYFYFEVTDNEILLESEFKNKRSVEKEDRVELFFSKDDQMNEYYCFEMDADARTLAYSAKNYRIMDFSWDAPAGFKIASQQLKDGYAVEGMIPMQFLKYLEANGEVYFGAYRAEFSKKDSVTVENWLTWVDPKTEKPDFHLPSSLGKLILK